MSGPVSSWKPFDPAVLADPYPLFAWLPEHQPVHYQPELGTGRRRHAPPPAAP